VRRDGAARETHTLASRAGGVLPSLEYRFTDPLSMTVGMLCFSGRTQLSDRAVQGASPVIDRVGRNACWSLSFEMKRCT
jgi:hypothetical protein